MTPSPLFVAFMLFGLKLEHVNPWDGSTIAIARALPKMERVDPYDGSPIELPATTLLDIEDVNPWDAETTP